MLLQRRQASESTGKAARARWDGLSAASHAAAASRIGAVDTPVRCSGNRPGTTAPPAVIPRKGSATAASARSR